MPADGELFTAPRPRSFVGVSGPDAADYLERMLSNEVATLAVGGSCEALLLTPKARVIAPLRVLRRADEDFLLLTEPELGERVIAELSRMRFAARIDIHPEDHTSTLVLGLTAGNSNCLRIENDDYGTPGVELIDGQAPSKSALIDDERLEELRIRASTPRFGREIDDRVLPAEAGLVERAVSFDKGCFPGQEPIARLHYRGHANRSLRRFEVEGAEAPAFDTPIYYEGKDVGRVTSAVRVDGAVLALGYVRREVPENAAVQVGSADARSLD